MLRSVRTLLVEVVWGMLRLYGIGGVHEDEHLDPSMLAEVGIEPCHVAEELALLLMDAGSFNLLEASPSSFQVQCGT